MTNFATAINGRELIIDRVRVDAYDVVKTRKGWKRLEGYRARGKARKAGSPVVRVEHVWTSYKGTMNAAGERDRIDVTAIGTHAGDYAEDFLSHCGGKIFAEYNDVRHIVATF